MKAIDPVCHMDVEPETAAGKSEYKGETCYFCSPGCKRAFDQNPEKYLTGMGGLSSHHGHHAA